MSREFVGLQCYAMCVKKKRKNLPGKKCERKSKTNLRSRRDQGPRDLERVAPCPPGYLVICF